MNRSKAVLVLCFLWLALLLPAGRLLAYRDLETGTFLTRDPAGMVDGPNLYAYVNQNPWTKFDPEGLEGYFPRTQYERDGGTAPDIALLQATGAWANGHPRTMGVVKAVGSTGEMAVGVAGAMAPTGVTQVLGGAAIAHGGDGFQAGVRQAWNGAPTETFTQQAVTGVAGAAGASPATAQTIGAVGDGLLGVGLTLEVSGGLSPVKSAAAISAETKNAVDAARPPLASVFDGHSSGQGFTGVYDASTGKVLIKPSTAEAVIPEGWVARTGGHADVSTALGGDAASHSGFAVILQEDGSLNATWRSGTLNRTPGSLVPPVQRPAIIDAVKSATGKTVNE